MPVDDHQLERVLRDAAPEVDPAGVLDRVRTKRARRRTTRRMEAGALAVVVVAVLGLTAVLTIRDNGSSPEIAAPGTQLSARVVTGDGGRAVTPRPVTLDSDSGRLRGPLFVGSTALSLASEDRSEGALSLVVRVDGAHVVDIVDFKAEVISITEGEGARWAVTRNPRATGGTIPGAFLKRIAIDGSATSTMLPVDADPVGAVAAVGGAVWVPTRAGLVQFDTTGTFVRAISLIPSDARSVAAIGKSAWVTDGSKLRRLDPSRGATADTRDFGGATLLSAAGDVLDGWLLLGPGSVGLVGPDLTVTDHVTLPTGFVGATVTTANDRVWVTGTVDDTPAIALLEGTRVRATVILQNARDAALAWTAPNTVTAVSNGELVQIPVS